MTRRSLDIARFWTTASKAAKAWAARKQAELDARADEFHARNADLDDTPSFWHPLWHLYAILFLLIAIGVIVTVYALTSHVDLHPIIAH